jgi:hypothetical protein
MPLTDKERDLIMLLVEVYRDQSIAAAAFDGIETHMQYIARRMNEQTARAELRAALGFDDAGEGEER